MKTMSLPKIEKRDIYVDSDKYLNDPEHAKDMEEYCKPIPVDLNKGFVPIDKFGSDNLEKTEENIGDRFSLGGD